MIDPQPIGYKDILDHMLEGCQIVSADDTYVYLNTVALKYSRKTRDEIIGRKMGEVYPGIEKSAIYQSIRECRASGQIKHLINHFEYEDGTVAWFEFNIQCIPEGVMITTLDISEHKNSAEKIQKLNRMHKVLSNINQTIVRQRDLVKLYEQACKIAVEDGCFLRAWITHFDAQYTQAELVTVAGSKNNLLSVFLLDDREALDPSPLTRVANSGQRWINNDLTSEPALSVWRQQALASGCRSTAAFPLVVAGVLRGTFSLESTEPNFFDESEIGLMDELASDIAFAIDVTENEARRETIEKALGASEERYRALVEVSPFAVFVQTNGNFAYINEAGVRLFGAQTREEILGKRVLDFIHPSDRETVAVRINHLNVDRLEMPLLQETFLRVDGSSVEVEAAGAPITYDNSKGAIVVCHDITDRISMDRALQESEMRYLSMVETAPLGILIVRENRIGFANQELLNLLGAADLEALQQQDLQLFVYSEDRERVRENITLAIECGAGLGAEPARVFNARLVSVIGGISHVEISAVIIKDNQGSALLLMISDLTQRLDSERRIYVQSYMLNAVSYAVIAANPDGVIYFWNKYSELLYGWTTEEVIGHNILEFTPLGENTEIIKGLIQRLNQGETATFELNSWARTGRVFPVLVKLSPIHDGNGAMIGILCISLDLTDQKRTEETLRQRLVETEALYALSSALRTASTTDEVFSVFLEQTLKVIGCEDGSVWTATPQKNGFKAVVAHHRHKELENLLIPIGHAVVGEVFATGEVQFVDQENFPAMETNGNRYPDTDSQQGIGVPIKTSQEIAGVVVATFSQGETLNQQQVKLLGSLGELAGAAIQRIRMLNEMVLHLEQLKAMRAIDVVINSSLDLNHTLNNLLEHITLQLGVDTAAILLLEKTGGVLVYAAGKGYRTRLIESSRVWLGAGVAGRVAFERRMIIFPSPDQQYEIARPRLWEEEGFQVYAGIPLVVKGQVKGVLEVGHRSPMDFDTEWISFFEALAEQTAIAIDNSQMFTNLQHANQAQAIAYDETIEGWSRALDLRDNETEGHTRRVSELTLKLAERMGLSDKDLVQIRWGALLHDIGKVGIPDHILLKPGPLTPEEWVIMRKHPQYALDLIAPIAYLSQALDIPYCHHEKWDGSGYPRGLRGEEIPLSARIFSIIDVWDAVTSDRPYRKAWSKERASEYIRQEAGKSFDAKIVEEFFKLLASEKDEGAE